MARTLSQVKPAISQALFGSFIIARAVASFSIYMMLPRIAGDRKGFVDAGLKGRPTARAQLGAV